ncbi:hypothetical protein PQ465_11100 [Sphingobacterium oryzagri]|uniref:Uncharacterized protein n=1 Tax=Sphingobacterium oryzagri TaxID=3025669 RepID=A0ABY7WEI6_9SPHI|nr:hypothetical protein [Sphingobacterium sp. KACC 22765]WDF66852.1 hypothetical protein PQ465_11100 [Sphingobacterium sp. KACC 22765]
MSAHKFSKEDFDELDGVFVYATSSDDMGTVSVYELIDAENIIYQEVSIIDSALLAGVLTLIANKPFDGQAVITPEEASVSEVFQQPNG